MIIHSPEISGSLTLVGGAVIKDPVFSGSVSSVGDTGDSVYSGSFSGSINGIGDPETFSASIATDFSNLSSDFDELTNNPFTQSANSVTITKDLIPNDSEIDLGSPSQPFKDLYLSSASLYINGTQVLSTDSGDLTLTTDTDQSLRIVESGLDTITLQTENGDIALASSGTGGIELNATVRVLAGKQILSSDGNAIQFGEDIDIDGDITTTGTVDGVDIASFKSDFDTLEGKTLVSGSGQIIGGTGILSSSNEDFSTFSASVATDFSNLSTDYNDLQNIPVGIISGSDQLTGSLVDISSDQTISGTKTFNDIVVNGTGSFAVIESVSGTAKIIGDAFIILNNNTPSERYAGIKVQDSGSAGVTASLQFDGEENDWFYQYSDDGGVTVDHGVVLFGPEYSSIGVPTYPTNNTIQKGNGGHHLLDSNITDDGTTITLGSNTVVNGTLLATGTALISGSSQVDLSEVSGDTDDLTEGSSNVFFTDDRVKTKLDLDGVHSGSNQEVQFAKVGVGGTSDATYELKVTGDIGATGDIVAYISSDERLKDNIQLIENPIDKLEQLRGVTWEWNDDASDAAKDSPNVGVIAQDVERVLPQLVHDRENGYKGVDYSKLTGLLIEAVKEQQDHISRLEERLLKLEG